MTVFVVPAHKTKDSNRAVFEYNIRKPAYSVTQKMSFGLLHVCHISNEHMDLSCL